MAHTSCVGSGGDPAKCAGSGQADQGHGTHVAGIVAAIKDNGKGIAGVAPDAELVVAKVLSAAGAGTTEDINAGIRWVVDHGARVVNLSLSATPTFSSPASPERRWPKASSTPGTTGRCRWSPRATPIRPASGCSAAPTTATSDALVVGATGPADQMAPYSSPQGNAKWSIVAPGGMGGGVAPGGIGGSTEARDILSSIWAKDKSPNCAGRLDVARASSAN